MRKNTKEIKVGSISLGAGKRIPVQSMLNTDPHDPCACISQIRALQNAGCDIVRLTIPDEDAALSFRQIRRSCPDIPLVADIHFDYRLALLSAEYGVDKIRINPGNIGSEERVKAVAEACKKRNIPIRIGVNGGSLEKSLLEKYGRVTPEALYESALGHIGLLNKFDFDDIVISVKSSDVNMAIEANRYVSSKCSYPLHIGVTEAGSMRMGIIKNSEAIGALLHEGIGDTVRVSLTADPVEEVYAAKDILRAQGCEGHDGMNIVSCPTCGRTKINLVKLVSDFEQAARRAGIDCIPVKVALMGCVVNGPGEAREADIGVAGGDGEALLFEHGKALFKIPENQIIEVLIKYIKENF